MKAPACDYQEIKIHAFGYGLYLGAIWWNTGKEHWLGRNIRYYPRFSFGKLINSSGVSFWDKQYWK